MIIRCVFLTLFLNSVALATGKISLQEESFGSTGLKYIQSVHLDEHEANLSVLAGSINGSNILSIYNVNTATGELKKSVSQYLDEYVKPNADFNQVISNKENIYVVAANDAKLFHYKWDKVEGNISVRRIFDIPREGINIISSCCLTFTEDKRFLYLPTNKEIQIYSVDETGDLQLTSSYQSNKIILKMYLSPNGAYLTLFDQYRSLSTFRINYENGELVQVSSKLMINSNEEWLINELVQDRSTGELYALGKDWESTDQIISKLEWSPSEERFDVGAKVSVNNFTKIMSVNNGKIVMGGDQKVFSAIYNSEIDSLVYQGMQYTMGVNLTDAEIIQYGDNAYIAPDSAVAGMQHLQFDNTGNLVNIGKKVAEKVENSFVLSDTAITSDGIYMYGLDDSNGKMLKTFKRDLDTGSLTLLESNGLNEDFLLKEGDGGYILALDQLEKFLYVNVQSKMFIYHIDPETKLPKFYAEQLLPVSNNAPHDMYITNDNRFMYILGRGILLLAELDQDDGALNFTGLSNFIGPNQMIFTSDGSYAYMMDKSEELGPEGAFYSFRIDPKDGTLFYFKVVSHRRGSEAIAISHDEKYLFVENESGIMVYERDHITGEIILIKTITGYTDNDGVERSLGYTARIFRLGLSEDDKTLFVYSFNSVKEFNIEENWNLQFINRIYLQQEIDHSSGSGYSFLNISPDNRFAYYSGFNDPMMYKFALDTDVRPSVQLIAEIPTFTLGLGEVSIDVSGYFQSETNLHFSAANLPPGLEITSSGVIEGTIERKQVNKLEYTGRVIGYNGVNSAQSPLPVIINLANNKPESLEQTYEVISGENLIKKLPIDDLDEDESAMKFVTYPEHGVLSMRDKSTGAFQYTPNQNYVGSDYFEFSFQDDFDSSAVYSANINVLKANEAPLAADDYVTVEYETALQISVLDNDSDSDGALDLSSINIIQQAGNGVTELTTEGNIVYTPNNNFSGDDEFSYTVKDNDGVLSNEAFVFVTVTPLSENGGTPDPEPEPEADSGSGGGSIPIFMLFLLLFFRLMRTYK